MLLNRNLFSQATKFLLINKFGKKNYFQADSFKLIYAIVEDQIKIDRFQNLNCINSHFKRECKQKKQIQRTFLFLIYQTITYSGMEFKEAIDQKWFLSYLIFPSTSFLKKSSVNYSGRLSLQSNIFTKPVPRSKNKNFLI